ILREVDDSGADYAETYYSASGDIDPGTVVVSDPTIKAGVKSSTTPYQNGLMGIVSTQPGEIVGDGTNSGTPVALALAGRVPVKVSTENGPIKAGDYLTSSSTPGVAMKATKAGNVIGTAMENYDAAGVGSITAFVGNGQFAGVLPLNSDGSSPDSDQLLAELIAGQAQPDQNSGVSQVFADHIAASIDVVTPALVTDSVETNNIVIGKNGINFTDGAGNIVASIDNSGTFHGQTAVPATSTSSSQPTSNQVVATDSGFSLNDPSGRQLISFDAAGDASFSGDLNFASAVASGGLQIGGDLNVGGLSSFQKLATFFAKTIFRQDVEFQGHITVANDTAGYAQLRQGESSVHVKFTNAYDAAPVVTANSVDGQFLSLSVANITKDGFDIKLPVPASQDTTLDWTALAVTNPQTATNPLPATAAAGQ
ncbi:MAG TPA: hypothetical protein VG604_02935, partial [Candidatus Saccharimonadales bacterium]|nr:hypothetical protein [Candidatus Saccharimonadales bacterium]